MDVEKIGAAIASLRKEKNLSQKALAEALHVSNKTVSKWECGQGCPDAGLWDALAQVLGADLLGLLQGEVQPKKPDIGRMEKVRFYVCPLCGNIITATTAASFSCCGRSLEPLLPEQAQALPQIEDLDNDYYISFDHPMTKENYLLFVAYVCDDRNLLVRLYPEQAPAVHLPMIRGRGTLYFYSTTEGLKKCSFKAKTSPRRENLSWSREAMQ